VTVFVFLLYGRSPAAERELGYALETLGGEIAPSSRAQRSDPAVGGGADDADLEPLSVADSGSSVTARLDGFASLAMTDSVVLYTDRPQDFGEVHTVDAGELLAATGEYRHGVKPRVLADALRRFGRDCVMLDLDGFIRPGFARYVEKALAEGAAMNQFVRRDPYPFFREFQTELPHLGRYRLDRDHALMLNSGLVAVRAEHLPLIEDAIVLIDRLWAAGLHKHDIEQFAVAETLRLGGVKIALIDQTFEHYCPRWSRRYMRRRLRARAPGARIPYSKTRVRGFKTYWTLRLAMRKARLSWRALWRKT
jgi:hypothetical protein